ncbi:MAG: hypothetical protein ABRQ39_31850, partial [Candidatus Eremiobacterota bacterium]
MDETNIPGNTPEPETEPQSESRVESQYPPRPENLKPQKKSVAFWLSILFGALLLLSVGVNVVLSI